ncbi:MAG: phosphoenolpyruvate synthase [Patescibacteria group bacterium]
MLPNDQNLYTVNFNQVDRHDLGLVGGKGGNLGELVQAGFPVPPGFIITSTAYFEVIKANNLKAKIQSIIDALNVNDPQQLNSASHKIKKLIVSASIPDPIIKAIIKSYLKLGRGFNSTLVAVRSSATAEDLPGASFAGQQETFLNIKGEANLIQAVRECWASLFEPRAIFYRQQKGFAHFKIGIALPVETMVQSEISGIMFTVNPVTNDKNQIVIEAIWGLGEKIVQGAYTPDHYLVQKLTWQILQKQLNHQPEQMILKNGTNQDLPVPQAKQNRHKLTDEQIIFLAKLGHQLQQHYYYPQDIEWAIDKDKVYLVQSRPVTTLMAPPKITSAVNTDSLTQILRGEPASPGIATGYVRILKSAKEINLLKTNEILVTEMTTPDFVPAMKKAAAIVTDKGGQTSHAAIVSRELGIPCIVGSKTATKILATGQVITVNGQTGAVFKPKTNLPSVRIKVAESIPIPPKKLVPDTVKTATKVYVNLGEPDLASVVAQKNVDGVGLLRAEFMIAQQGIHPKKLISQNKSSVFTDMLSTGLEKFCRAFYPRPVVYRATDFKSNEYANLIGGKDYEPIEPNPMLGYRGAYRYLVDQAVFNLELTAISHVRNKLGLANLWLMLPFVRTVDQLVQVKKIITAHGLIRSANFKLWLMVEIPSNVILLEDFLKVGIDGVSIGSNDLTMLILGVDRDNSEVASVYDERNPAVMWAFEKTIKTCVKNHITVSMCGQAPSVYPDLTQKLVEWGTTSVSVSHDAIDSTRQIIYQAEMRLINHG